MTIRGYPQKSGRMIANENVYTMLEFLCDHNKIIEFIPDEPHVCKHFGCGRVLSPMEILYSDYCFNHNKDEAVL